MSETKPCPDKELRTRLLGLTDCPSQPVCELCQLQVDHFIAWLNTRPTPAPVGERAARAVARGAMEACVDVTEQLAAARAEIAEKDAEIERLKDEKRELEDQGVADAGLITRQSRLIDTLVKALRAQEDCHRACAGQNRARMKVLAVTIRQQALAAADAWRAK